MEKTQVTKDLENKTLTIERVFDAPITKLWQAYADQTMFEKWWGPEGWETTTKEFNFTPGGKIHYCMKCVDKNQGDFFGFEAWGKMQIESIDEPNAFSALDYFSNAEGTHDETKPTQRFTLELREEGGKTRMLIRTITETTEQLEELIKMGMIEGFDSSINKLEKLMVE